MKILFDQQIFVSQKYGGISRYFYEIAKSIHGANGTRVAIFAPLHACGYFQASDGIGIFGIKIPARPKYLRIAKAIDRRLQKIAFLFFRDIDIFHETYYSIDDNCPMGAKRVITVYDMIHEKFPKYFSTDADEQFKAQKALAIRRADHIICISECTKRDLVEILDIPANRISVVYLGCTLALSGSHAPAKIPHVRPYLLYVGQRNAYKNFERLLQAYASSKFLMDSFELVCFGGGAFNQEELDTIRALDIPAANVKYIVGDDSHLASAYGNASAFVYPSLYEGFGIPPLEAMSFGCPVACSNGGSMPEVVADCADMFDPMDASDICRTITRLVTKPDHARKLVEKGRLHSANFTWEKCGAETLKIYRHLVAK